GLRTVFAPTTEFRVFWNQLAGDVLADRCDPSVQAAIAGLRRVDQPPWAPALDEALGASAQIAQAAVRFAAPLDAAPATSEPASLWLGVVAPPALHPTGLPAGAAAGTCGACAWRHHGRCRQAGARVDPAWPACERFEAALDCQT